MQTITEQLTDIARGTRRMLIGDVQEAADLTDAEAVEVGKGIAWTGRTMQRDGATYFEFTTPGSWTGKAWAAIVGGILFSFESDDANTTEGK